MKEKGDPWPGMSRADFDACGDYLRQCADIMELRDWEFILLVEPLESTSRAEAMIDCVYGRKVAEIQLSRTWQTLPAEKKRHYVAHELIHCHFDECFCVLESCRKVIGDPAFHVAKEEMRRALEFGVDAMASAIALRFPRYPDSSKVAKVGRRRKARR